MITMDDFFNQMIKFFPQVRFELEEHFDMFGERLDTVVVEDIIMPRVMNLLEKNCNEELLGDIFNYFELVSVTADEHLLNVFSITTLEILGNDADVLRIAKQYMGPKTTQYQREADLDLGRIRE